MFEKTFNIKNENVPFVSSEKTIKSWNVENRESTGGTVYFQSPSEEELLAANLQRGNDTTSYTFTTKNTADVYQQFISYAEIDLPVYDITATKNDGGIWTVNVKETNLVPIPRGAEHEDDVDYGSEDGETDYSDWTSERHARTKSRRYQIIWEPGYEWPPFKLGNEILIKPDGEAIIAQYKALEAGYRPGDLINYNGQTKTIGDAGTCSSSIIPDDIFDKFIKRVKILVIIESRQWVISSAALRKGHLYADETLRTKKNRNKVIWFTRNVQGNRDGKLNKDTNEPDSKTYTVTETTTTKEPYKGQKIPNGYELEDLTKDQ